eukprot:s142_g3.t1
MEASHSRSLGIVANSVDDFQIVANKAVDSVWSHMVVKKKFDPSWNMRSPEGRREVALRAWAELSTQAAGSPLSGIYSVLDDGTFAGYSVNHSGRLDSGLLWDAPAGGSPLTSRRTELATGRRDGPLQIKGHVNMTSMASHVSLDKAAKVHRTWSPVFGGSGGPVIALEPYGYEKITWLYLALLFFGAMHPYHHAATVQYGQPQPQPQRQTYIHSVSGQPIQMQPMQAMQAMQPQIQGYRAPSSGLAPSVGPAQYTFYGASNAPMTTPNPAMWQPGMMPPSGSFPGLAAHPLPPEHSIGPSEAGAAGTAVPEAQESSSEYDAWRSLSSGSIRTKESASEASAASPASPSSPAPAAEAAEAAEVSSPVESPVAQSEGEAAGVAVGLRFTGVPPPTSAGELDAGVIAGMPPSMTISQVPSIQSERQDKDSFTNVNYQTHDPRAPVKEDINLQTRIDAKLINEAPMLPTRSKITTDEHLESWYKDLQRWALQMRDQVLFPRGFRVDRTLPSKRKGLSPGALGKGAFGVVYKGFKRDGEEVALKVSENATATQPMLDQEISILKMLDHPSIVKFYDAFVDKESDWMIIAMELVSGGDLLSSLTGEPQVYEERDIGEG